MPTISDLVKQAAAENQLRDDPHAASNETLSKSSSMLPVLAALLGGAGDTISTQIGLAKGAREENPIMTSNRVGNLLGSSGEYIGAALLAKLLAEHGHPTLGKIIGYGAGGMGGVATAQNIDAIRKWDKIR